jgi:hypothetical protein
MMRKKIVKIILAIVGTYIAIVVIEFVVLNTSLQKTTYGRTPFDSAGQARMREVQHDIRTQDSIHAADSVRLLRSDH